MNCYWSNFLRFVSIQLKSNISICPYVADYISIPLKVNWRCSQFCIIAVDLSFFLANIILRFSQFKNRSVVGKIKLPPFNQNSIQSPNQTKMILLNPTPILLVCQILLLSQSIPATKPIKKMKAKFPQRVKKSDEHLPLANDILKQSEIQFFNSFKLISGFGLFEPATQAENRFVWKKFRREKKRLSYQRRKMDKLREKYGEGRLVEMFGGVNSVFHSGFEGDTEQKFLRNDRQTEDLNHFLPQKNQQPTPSLLNSNSTDISSTAEKSAHLLNNVSDDIVNLFEHTTPDRKALKRQEKSLSHTWEVLKKRGFKQLGKERQGLAEVLDLNKFQSHL